MGSVFSTCRQLSLAGPPRDYRQPHPNVGDQEEPHVESVAEQPRCHYNRRYVNECHDPVWKPSVIYGPEINDLVVELKPVTRKWHDLGIQLRVPPDKLDKIDEDYRTSERKLYEVLLYWLQNEVRPSWDKICEVLHKIGGFGRLVRELRMKYGSLKTYREQHTHHETAAEVGEVNVVTCQADSRIQEVIENLQREFSQRVSRIRLSLTEITSPAAIKELLKELPAGEVKNQVSSLLSQDHTHDLIKSSGDIDQLFMRLSSIQAWDFLHPQLLEYLVQELGDNETKKIMKEYKSLLIQFRSTTKMSELSGWFGDISEASNFKKVVLSLGDNWKNKTYEEFEALRVSLLRQRVFFHASLHLCGVLNGSMLVALTVIDFNHTLLLRMQEIVKDNVNLMDFFVANEIAALYAETRCLIRNKHERHVSIPNINPDTPNPDHKTVSSLVNQPSLSGSHLAELPNADLILDPTKKNSSATHL